jgi:hypothetical protein
MNKTSVNKSSFMAFLSLAGMVLLGCCHSVPGNSSRKSRQVQNDFGSLVSKTIVKSESIPLSPEYENPRMIIIVTIQDVLMRGKLGRLIQDVVFNGDDPETYGEKLIADYRSQYQNEGKKAMTNDGFPGEIWNWEYNETIEGSEIIPERTLAGITKCFVISRSRYYYMGGAHSLQEKQYFLFDMVKNKTINLDELIRENTNAALQQLIAAELREQAGIKKNAPLSQAGFFADIPDLTENFFLTPEGIGFHWNPYEIAPYSTGSVEVVLPYDELMDVLR